MRRFIVGVLAACLVGLAAPAAAEVGRESGLPLPRFVSLAAKVANLRLGPGADAAVVAVYRRRGLPLLVVDEQDNWRQVEDFAGDRGWMHASLLSGRRTAIVVEAPRILRRAPGEAGLAIARVEPTVVASLLSCDGAWCFVEVQGRRGWLPRAGLWGAEPRPAPNEAPISGEPRRRSAAPRRPRRPPRRRRCQGRSGRERGL